MKRTLLAGIAVTALVLTGCSSDSERANEVTNTSAVTTTSDASSLNKRGALEVAMGETATVTKNGALVLEVSDTSLSTEGCEPHRKQPDTITKYVLNATITTGNETSVQWLWPTDFYYVDATGKVTKNSDVTDTNPCAGGTSNSFIRTPTNSSADGRPTLDIPNGTVFIGYSNSTGPDVRIEWRLTPDAPATSALASPAATSSTMTPTGRQLYVEACADSKEFFKALRELAEMTGEPWDQEKAADEFMDWIEHPENYPDLQDLAAESGTAADNEEWDQLSKSDQAQVREAVKAAAKGNC
ncbi:hypothetical protein A5N78_04415 [Prescottella equi]|uniref:hypothetical protein n=1 Tax=Rhodococcus hoagii TaxID=43767 RepID=UPI000A10AF77|nr:hypothetical protein [Prescottella equi]ORL93384.1 hypothetical protein A5N78_04415 [Prescottella equi]ORM17737.1 hypothetical protein A5N70_10990 [Prescottella equi]